MQPEYQDRGCGGSAGKLMSVTQTIRTAYTDPTTRNQIIRFLCVGLMNTVVGYGSFFLLVNYLTYLIALLVAHLIGVTHSFFWNKYWIFKTRKLTTAEFVKFNIVYAFVYITNAVALYFCVEMIKIDPKPAQLILLPVVTIISFFGQKLWTFK